MRLFYIYILISIHSFGQLNPSIYSKVILDKNVNSPGTIGIINKVAWFSPKRIGEAKQFEKVELGIELSQTINNRILKFIKSSGSKSYPYPLNPFNPEDIDIKAEIYNQQNIKVNEINGFFYEEFKRDKLNNQWKKDTTSYNFRIRMSFENIGNYKVVIYTNIKRIYSDTCTTQIKIKKGSNPGFLELGEHKKHLRFSDNKKSFLGVGQVIPWTESDGWDKIPQGSGSRSFDEMYNALNAFSNAKGNFTRFVAAPWFMQLDWESLGNYQKKMNHAWEFDRINDFCNNKLIYFIYCAYLHAPLQKRTDEEDARVMPGVRWEDNAYNDNDISLTKVGRENKIGATEPIDFYRNERAKFFSKNHFRYIIARWGYSTAFSGLQLLSEIDDTGNYRDEKINDSIVDHTKNREIIKTWVHEMVEYIGTQLNSRQLLSVALINGVNGSCDLWDPEIFNHPQIDFVGLHNYTYEMSPSSDKIRNRNLLLRYPAVTNLNTGYQKEKLSHPTYQNKCFIYDEFGHLMSIPRKWPEDKKIDLSKILNDHIPFMIKQDLWFTLASGCAVSGLDWWNYYTKTRHELWRELYPPIHDFIKDIDFETNNYDKVRMFKNKPIIAQRWPENERKIERSNGKKYRKSDLLEAYTQVSSDGERGFGWISNRSVNWPNMLEEDSILKKMYFAEKPFSKKYLHMPKDDDKTSKPINIEENKTYFKIRFLNPRATYRIVFYNTKTGNEITKNKITTNRRGIAKIYAPKMLWTVNPDIAFKFSKERRLSF